MRSAARKRKTGWRGRRDTRRRRAREGKAEGTRRDKEPVRRCSSKWGEGRRRIYRRIWSLIREKRKKQKKPEEKRVKRKKGSRGKKSQGKKRAERKKESREKKGLRRKRKSARIKTRRLPLHATGEEARRGTSMRSATKTMERTGQLERWSAEAMEEDEKEWVRATLRRHAEAKGGVTEATARAMTRLSTMTDRFSGRGRPSASDVVWAWIAEQQATKTGLVAAGLQRRSMAQHAQPIPRWRWYATVRSGWIRTKDATREAVEAMAKADRVLAALWREQVGEVPGEFQKECLAMEHGLVRAVWGKVKSGFRGHGGYGDYLSVVALLMLMGAVEGGVGESPKEQWWQQGVAVAKQVLGEEAVVDQEEVPDEEGSACPEVRDETQQGVRVVIDWMSGSQSLRRAVPKGVMYIGFDIQEWVYSGAERVWVRNEVADLLKVQPVQLEEKAREIASRRCGRPVEIEVKMIGLSPCCRTFSKTDSSNQSRGNNYRDHQHPDRPPKDKTSAKGKLAVQADKMVEQGIGVARWFSRCRRTKFYMENPVGSLWRRPYMRRWEAQGEVVRRQVDYCAYGHMYMKPTHIWTNMKKWKPKGEQQGGNGRCRDRCRAGEWGASGKWVHRCKIAQGSRQAAGGAGRKARKNMMPVGLQRELLKAALR